MERQRFTNIPDAPRKVTDEIILELADSYDIQMLNDK